MNAIAEENEFKSLTITHLKTYLAAKCNTFKKDTRQEALDHYEEVNKNSFCRFAHDGAALLDKDKHRAFGMQFEDTKFRHNDVIALSFRKPLSHEANKVSELAEEACNEFFDLDFTDAFSSSAQDLAASALSKEFNTEKVECDMHQGDKVGASAVWELTRRKDKDFLIIPVVFILLCLY